jgi:MFS family permease
METSTTGQATASPGILAVLRNRNFLYLWVAQLFSQTAQQMINYVLVVQVDALSQSSTAVSGIIIAFTLPAILFSAVAGVYVDRQPKRRVLIITNAGRALTMLGYIFLTDPHFGLGALTVIYLATLIFASVSQFFVPAEGAAIPLLVKRDQLIAANSLFNLTFTGSQLLGFLILGPLFLKLLVRDNNFGPFYIVLGVLYLGCTLLTWLLPNNERVEAAENGDGTLKARVNAALDELKEGWSYIRTDQWIFGAIIQWSVAIAVLMMLAVVGPRFIAIELGLKPEDLYLLLFPGGVGLVAGVILVGRWATEQNRLRMINYAMLAAGVGLLIFSVIGWTVRTLVGVVTTGQPPWVIATSPAITAAASPWLIGLMMILIFMLGALNSFVSVPAQTTLQERAREDIRARVFSAFYTVSNIILLIPLVVAGLLASTIGVVQTVALIGVAVIGVAFWGIRRGLDQRAITTPLSLDRPKGLVAPTGDALNSGVGVTAHEQRHPPTHPPENGAHAPVPAAADERRD